jgi:uncharacterized protein YndB with AHSA1/START domain
MIDATTQISEVRRLVGTRTLEAGEARVMAISQTYHAPIEDVWDACTSPERIPRWFLPISGELRLGGRYQLTGNAAGTVERCEPPHSFAVTWEYGGEVSWVEVRLTAEPDGGTRFELEHVAHVDEQRWDEFGPGAMGVGWDLGLVGLTLHLSPAGAPAATDSVGGADTPATAAATAATTGEPSAADGPPGAAAWLASEDGRRFIADSSQRWCEASIAAGTDPTDAQAAAARTTTAYTAAPPDATDS